MIIISLALSGKVKICISRVFSYLTILLTTNQPKKVYNTSVVKIKLKGISCQTYQYLRKEQLEAYNNRDINAFMNCYSENCIVEDGSGNILMDNKDAMRKRYALLFQESPNLHCGLVSRIVLENYVLDEERVTGSRGSSEERHVVAVYKIENGLITHVRFLN